MLFALLWHYWFKTFCLYLAYERKPAIIEQSTTKVNLKDNDQGLRCFSFYAIKFAHKEETLRYIHYVTFAFAAQAESERFISKYYFCQCSVLLLEENFFL